MKLKHFTLVITVLALLTACADDDTVKKPTAEGLVPGKWKLVDWYADEPVDIDGDGVASTDLFSQWNGCRKNNTLILNDDFTAQMIEPGNPDNPDCITPVKPDYIIGPWQFDENDETGALSVVFIHDDYFDGYEIEEITQSTLVLKGSGFLTCCGQSYTDGYVKFTRQ